MWKTLIKYVIEHKVVDARKNDPLLNQEQPHGLGAGIQNNLAFAAGGIKKGFGMFNSFANKITGQNQQQEQEVLAQQQ